jgi:hypothetical protein
MRPVHALASAGAGLLTLLAIVGAPSDARACGGCFHEPTQNPDVITDHRMIFRITPNQTTLYDEIEYSGNPASFAWVLPTHGPVTIGLSSDAVFSSLDQATAPQIEAPNLPACASCSCNFGAPSANAGASGGGSGGSSGGGGVQVLSQQTVGPYATVQLSSTNPTALNDWLTANGYDVPTAVQPIISAYVNEGFDFLALKLAPGQNVSAMRPVRVTATGAGLTLPLRMVAAGTGPTVGITLFVMGDGRYEAQNFPNFTIGASQLTWDFAQNQSNYTTVRSQLEAKANNATWQTESAMQISTGQLEDPIMYGDPTQNYLPIMGGTDDAGVTTPSETAAQVQADDLAVLFPGSSSDQVWVTRMRGDLAHAALGNDLVLQASADQSQLSNFIQVTKYVNAPTCPAVPDPCPPCPNDPGSSSGAGSGGVVFGGSSGGATSGNSTNGSGCSTVSTVAGGDGENFGVVVAGLAVAAMIFGRGRKRRG